MCRALAVVALLLFAQDALARSDAKGVEFFETKIRPVLVEHCYRCHSAEAKKTRGGLAVDTRLGLREGGDSGPAVIPGKPQQSLLLIDRGMAALLTDLRLRGLLDQTLVMWG